MGSKHERCSFVEMGSRNTVLYKAGKVSQGLSRVNSIRKGREALSVFYEKDPFRGRSLSVMRCR